MKFLYRILPVVLIALLMVQCDLVDSELLNDPNNPSPENVDPDFLLNNIQLEGRNVYADISGIAAAMTRMRYMFGATYNDAYTPNSFNTPYTNAYADLFIDVQTLVPLAQESQLYFHSGIAKTIKAYAMLTLVDVFGNVPLSQALDPSVFNPGLDEGRAVYDSALTVLDSAIEDFQNEDRLSMPDNDLYYGTLNSVAAQEEAWIQVANTMKLKAYLNTGNAQAFNELVTSGNIILDAASNFTFEYGTERTNPDSRHPLFFNNYVNTADDYMALNYVNMLLNDKVDEDPRLRYYFYRQTTDDPTDINLNTCLGDNKPGHFQPQDPFCYPEGNGEGEGWWGRDHLIADGIPPDGDLRTTFGVYPVGGRFDANQGESTEVDQGYQGAGFQPMLMAAYTYFMIAEGQLRFNSDRGQALNALMTGIETSMNTIQSYGAEQANGTGLEMTADEIAEYQDVVRSRWSSRDPYRVVSKEYYLALWPNGLEAYNLIRRTGYPNRVDNLQPARTPAPGDWYSTFLLPAVLVERNSSVTQKPRAERVFWDETENNFNF